MNAGPSHTAAVRVYLTRHGRTVLNAENRLRGLADPPLDDVGLAEATRLAEAFAARGIQHVLSGPLQRARRTASIIAQRIGVDAVVDPRLNDRDYGPWTGHLKAEVTTRWGSADHAPGVEPVASVLERTWPVLVELGARSGASAIVTHDAVIRPILARIMGEQPNRDTRTGCWNELLRRDGEWHVVDLDRSPDSGVHDE